MNAGQIAHKDINELLSHIYQPLKKKIPVVGPRKKVIVIAGPTGVGKTRLSLSIAGLVNGEIISADSMQLYQGMDIGTAKASSEEQKKVPHHLIDVVGIHEEFNVVKYFNESYAALKSITARSRAPIVAGGSGFYIQSILCGPPPTPPSNPEVRKKLERQMDKIGCEAMYEQVQLLDPIYAETITEKDRHKVVRALEIMTISEQKVSDFQRSTEMKNDEFDFRLWFLFYPRDILYQKIEKRCDEMLEKGLLDEVKTLMDQGLEENKTASNAIGYKQAIQYLKSPQTKDDYLEFVYQFKKASRNYAKRQFTWFKKEKLFRPLDLSKMSLDTAKEHILQDFEQG